MQVSCGLYHTAVLTSSGTILAFGNNENGELGRKTDGVNWNHPRIVEGLGGRIAVQVDREK